MLFAHFEVLAEVLVTAPPVRVDHVEALVTSHLMEIGISHIVLDTIDGVSPIAMRCIVRWIALANSIAPVLNHPLLLVLNHHPEEETVP